MRLKKYLSIILSLFMFSPYALAEEAELSVKITDLEAGTVQVAGNADIKKAGFNVNMIVLKKTENTDNIIIQNQSDAITGEDGEFIFNFSVFTKDAMDEGWYSVYVGGDGIDDVKKAEFYFASNTRKKIAISEINKAANEGSDIFSEMYEGYSDMFDLKDAEIKGINKEEMYEGLEAYIKENNFSEDDFAKVREYYRTFNILSAYSAGLDICKDKSGELLLSELGIDIEKSDAVYSVYRSLTEKGHKALLGGMKDKVYKDEKDFEKIFKEQIIIAAILNPEMSGTGHIREILSDEVCEEIGIDISEYNNSKYKTEIEAQLLKSELKDAKSLEKEIKEITQEIKKKYSGGKGGSGGSSGGGISVGGSSNTVAPVTNTGVDYIKEETEIRDNPFLDIDVTHWAYPAVEQLYKRGIINGVSANSYSPDSFVTREQLAKIICAMLGNEGIEGNAEFSDVEQGRWSGRFINFCKDNGYVTGYPDGTFAPAGYVTRQDIAVVLYRVINKKAETSELQFADAENISDYAKEAVGYFVDEKILKGYEDNSFKPKKNCTRAEVASIVYKTLKEMEGNK